MRRLSYPGFGDLAVPRRLPVAIAFTETATDVQLVEAARSGDQEAFAGLYDRYFDRVYDFVARMTRDRDEAADIAQDTFIKAMGALGGLKEGASFKSWIFTIARNTTLNRLERSSRMRPLTFEDDEGEDVQMDVVDTDRFGDPAQAAEAAAMGSLVWEAAAGLDPKQLSLLQLHLHQGMESAEIAEVMGVTKNNGYVMLNRLKKAVEESIGAYIMLHDGRKYCEELDAALDSRGIREMSPETRKLVQRHVTGCDQCEERKKKMVSPLAVFGAFAPVGAPPALKADVLGQLMSQWPGPAAGGPPPIGGLVPAAGGGFGGGRVVNIAIGMGVFAAVLAFLLIFTPLNLLRGAEEGDDSAIVPVIIDSTETPEPPTETTEPGATDEPPAGTPTPAPTDTSTPGSSGEGQNLVTPPPAPADTATPAPTSTGTVTNTPTPSPTNTATNTPTATATPTTCVPQLEPNVQTLNMATARSQTFILFNGSFCGGSEVVARTNTAWLRADPATFDLEAGGQQTIFVTVDRAVLPPGPQSGVITLDPASGASVNVVVNVDGPTPTPTATPTNTPVPDTTGPSINLVSCTYRANMQDLLISVTASDPAGVTQVTATWGDQSSPLTLRSGEYTGNVAQPRTDPVPPFTVSAVDGEGNSSSRTWSLEECSTL